jgi:hypothetical protein
MTLSQSFFIPLYFDEAEADLWQALQQIEPEKRSTFIKASLRQILLNDNRAEASVAHSPQDEPEYANEFEELEELETFSLEDLFAEVHIAEPDAENVGPADYEGVKPTSPKLPWDYLLQTVIGVEQDETVIAAIKQAVQTEVQEEKSDTLPIKINHSEQPPDEPDEQGDSLADQEFDIESLRVDVLIAPTGFEYMMKHIIGTEEDESVLKILRGDSTNKDG